MRIRRYGLDTVDSHTNFRLQVLLILLLASTLVIFDFFVIVYPSVIADKLSQQYMLSASQIGLLGGAFYFSYALMQIPSGWLIGHFGARNTMTVFVFLTAAALLIFAHTQNFYIFVLTRLLMGCGLSLAFTSNYFLASRYLPHRYFSFITAGLHMLGTVGAMIAQKPLALFILKHGWHAAIKLCSYGMFGLGVLFFFFMFDGRDVHISQLARPKFKKALKFCYQNKQVFWVTACGFLGWMPLAIIGALWGIPFLTKAYHCSTVEASSLCSLFWIGSAIGGFVLSFLSEAWHSRKQPILLCFFISLCCTTLFICAPYLPKWLVGLSLFFLGICVCMQTLSFTLVKESVPLAYFSSACGFNNFGAMISSALSQNVVGILLDVQGSSSAAASVVNYQVALLLLPLAALVGLFVCHYQVKETYGASFGELKNEITDDTSYQFSQGICNARY